MNKLNALQANRMLNQVVLPEPDFSQVLEPLEMLRFTAHASRMVGMERLAPLKCKFSQKIAKKDGILSISEGERYIIATKSLNKVITTPWILEHHSQFEELKRDLSEGAVIGHELRGDKMRVIFTADDVPELELIEDHDTGWNQLIGLWVMGLVRDYLAYSMKESLFYDAHFDTDVQVPVFGPGEENLTAIEYFNNTMGAIFHDLETSITKVVRAHPYHLYTVEATAGGIALIRHEDVRIMLSERDREHDLMAERTGE